MATEPTQQYLTLNGTRLCVYQWGESVRHLEASIILIHATGFHARCWDQVVKYIQQQSGRRHIVAIDQRGHGLSDNTDYESWVDFSRDLNAVLEQLDIKQAIGVGHSMGGHITLVSAAHTPSLFSKLLLIEPVILPPEHYSQKVSKTVMGNAGLHPIAKRRRYFANTEEMVNQYAGKEPFSFFTKEVLADYCRYGLIPRSDDAGMELACPPEFEASIYTTVLSNTEIHNDVKKVTIPITILRAMLAPETDTDHQFKYSSTWPELAQHCTNASDHHLKELTHFMPMQDPQRIASYILGQT